MNENVKTKIALLLNLAIKEARLLRQRMNINVLARVRSQVSKSYRVITCSIHIVLSMPFFFCSYKLNSFANTNKTFPLK